MPNNCKGESSVLNNGIKYSLIKENQEKNLNDKIGNCWWERVGGRVFVYVNIHVIVDTEYYTIV